MNHYYGHRIRVLHWCTDQIMTDALAQMGLTASQGRIMGYLAHYPQPPCARDIAEAFQLSHPTVSGLLGRLEKKGFIKFLCDEQDRRSRRIYLLPKGLESVKRIEDTIMLNEQRMVQGFSGEEREQFMALLDRAISNMGGSPCQLCSMKED
ncbi:MAG: MarR family transcriptional regulator [Lachnospiraceae bacterium]|nr:MarR family transcriptional regulator [Lachnospiraceae bacterium]